jgi:hypothetical protein
VFLLLQLLLPVVLDVALNFVEIGIRKAGKTMKSTIACDQLQCINISHANPISLVDVIQIQGEDFAGSSVREFQAVGINANGSI